VKIDIFTHIVPPRYKKLVEDKSHPGHPSDFDTVPALANLEARFRIMDRFPDVVQVLTVAQHLPSDMVGPGEAVELSMRLNDEMAELVHKYPDRFAGAVAAVPINDTDAALKELDRAINQLHARGLLIRVPIGDKGPDAPEFMPIYEAMVKYNLPIWIHPQRRRDVPDYAGETGGSKYAIWHVWGLIFETTVAMTRLVFSKVLQQYPTLKIITHHCGAMIPYFAGRIEHHYDLNEMRRAGMDFKSGLTQQPADYFRMFYNDTAITGNTAALMCAYQFFGPEHLLFGSDAPFDVQGGAVLTRQTIDAIEAMTISDADKKKIFENNARKLCRLPLF